MARKGFGRVKRKSPEVPKTQELVFQETIVLYSEVEKSEVLVEDHGKKDGGFFNIMNWGRDKGQDEPVEISSDESIESSGDIVLSNSAQIEGRLKGNNVNIMNGNITGDINLNNDVILGEPSRIVGDVHARTLVSSGTIVGNVFIDEKVTLNETSFIEGNIQVREFEVRLGLLLKVKSISIQSN